MDAYEFRKRHTYCVLSFDWIDLIDQVWLRLGRWLPRMIKSNGMNNDDVCCTRMLVNDKSELVGGLVAILWHFPRNIGLLSSSQLTFIFFRGVAQPPTREDIPFGNW